MRKLFVVVSEETNKIGIYEVSEIKEVNCLVVYDSLQFDADNMKHGVLYNYAFSDENGNLLQEDEMELQEYFDREEHFTEMFEVSTLIDNKEFENIIN